MFQNKYSRFYWLISLRVHLWSITSSIRAHVGTLGSLVMPLPLNFLLLVHSCTNTCVVSWLFRFLLGHLLWHFSKFSVNRPKLHAMEEECLSDPSTTSRECEMPHFKSLQRWPMIDCWCITSCVQDLIGSLCGLECVDASIVSCSFYLILSSMICLASMWFKGQLDPHVC